MKLFTACRKLASRLGYKLIDYFLKKRNLDIIPHKYLFRARLVKILLYEHINVVLDIGAFSGRWAKLILRKEGYLGKIISFEPVKESFSSLLESSKNDPNWECYQLAIGAQDDGFATINVSLNLDSSSLLSMLSKHLESAPNSRFIRTEQVRVRRLDNLCSENELLHSTDKVFIKVDVQGYESEVLESAKNILPPAHLIQLELSLVSLYEGQLLYMDMLNMMHNKGYALMLLFPGFSDPVSGQVLQFDAIFKRMA